MIKSKSAFKTFTSSLPKNIFSGFVVSLIALPLGLGLALASEAPPIAGVISAVIGGTVVAILGGSHVTITGPGNGLVVILLSAITLLGGGNLYEGYIITLAAIVFSGALMMLLGFLRLGILSDFFPASAIQGMLAAIGISIFAKQFHVMLGQPETTGSVVQLLLKIPSAVSVLLSSQGNTSLLAAALVGVISLVIMFGYPKIRNQLFQLVPAPMWIVILVIGMSYYYEFFSSQPYPISEHLLINIPSNISKSFAFPDFSKVLSLQFWGVVFGITLIASIESLLSIKAVDKLDAQKRRTNVNKDLKALGLATIISGFVGGLNVVTVIARSSVNVNNSASNRSSNFFHAAFLLLFILLFSEQLKRIPLPALAAILVYTGLRLATPDSIRKISKIGNEQLLIFFITLLFTLVTNLITGISIGVLTTLITHMVINRSFTLFFQNFRKPNVLMFTEEKGNYYVSVKNFCSFLNFHRLKHNLDAIPESADVILDFTMCDFVDHTVLDNLNNYQQSFLRRGGHFEIIGLDSHDTDSVHPFAIRKIIPSKTITRIEKYLTKRQGLIKSIAQDFSWSYEAAKQNDVLFLYQFLFFETRKINHLYNELKNEQQDCRVFDIEYSEGAFIAKEVLHSTFLFININAVIPAFTLDREGLLEKVYQWAGFDDIDFQDHPDFSNRFYLYGENEEAIRAFFTDELILFFESNPYYHIESNGTALLIKGKERLFGIQEIKKLIDFGNRFAQLLKKHPFLLKIK
ncbi:SulP family inorganic anion transporter [Ascidiimonas sp. W6]|uniref:SulP family inorganic anion transporter n=1 Tax=Ascidiimonas meishanensis TaxID=3128903 RepID=UPI0030ED611B